MTEAAGTQGGWRDEIFGLVLFVVRCLLFTGILCGGAVLALKSVMESVKVRPAILKLQNEMRKEASRIRLTGLLTTNPAVHWRVSFVDEKAGRIREAMDEIELAIGLLEMNKADKSVLDRYTRRLEELKRKLPPEAAARKPPL